MKPAKLACFDLEGPLTAEDYAYRLFADHIEGGDRVYAVLSRYDDILTERCRIDYEPGDTLALVLPFLVAHGITSEDIKRHAQGAVSDSRNSIEVILPVSSWTYAADQRRRHLDGSPATF